MTDEFVKHPVELEDYNPLWLLAFHQEKKRISEVLPNMKLHIEHIGSTAIPLMPAKPIIDLMIGIDDLAQFDTVREALWQIDYIYDQVFENSVPDRRFFYRFSNGKISHQIHLVEYKSKFWVEKILFRDYLIANIDYAEEYYQLKIVLAEQYRQKRLLYSEAKGDFVNKILKLALQEQVNGNTHQY